MRRNESKPIGAVFLFAILLAGLPFLVACGGAKTAAPEARIVEVQITDQGIQMPPSLPSGVTTFKIANAGTSEHSFGITGPSGDMKLDAALKPGESASLDMVLDSGTYRVYSPTDPGQGSMQMALNVHPDTNPSRKG